MLTSHSVTVVGSYNGFMGWGGPAQASRCEDSID
jgi:hypothetical protein